MFIKLLHLLLAQILKSGTAADLKTRVFFELSGLLGFAAILRSCGTPMKTTRDVLEPFPSRSRNRFFDRENSVNRGRAVRQKLRSKIP